MIALRRLLLPIALVMALAASLPAGAHTRGTSYSHWTLDAEGASVAARVTQLELTRLQLDPSQTADYLARAGQTLGASLQLWTSAGACTPGTVTASPDAGGWLHARWRVSCEGGGERRLRSSLLWDVAPSHLHFARVKQADGAVVERVLTYAQPFLALDAPADLPQSFGHYVKLGVDHILSGWDHLAFVLALILLARCMSEVALIATGFTLAHSLTLSAAVLGWAEVRASAVEALIGFSIALVAIENLWLRGGRERSTVAALVILLAALALPGVTKLPSLALVGLALFTGCYLTLLRDAEKPLRWRIAIAFLFGLVHGFGFAGVMMPLDLPPGRLVAGLAGFNIGVELGQLLVIALAWPLLRALDRLPRLEPLTRDVASAAVCALGTFWFVTRTFA